MRWCRASGMRPPSRSAERCRCQPLEFLLWKSRQSNTRTRFQGAQSPKPSKAKRQLMWAAAERGASESAPQEARSSKQVFFQAHNILLGLVLVKSQYWFFKIGYPGHFRSLLINPFPRIPSVEYTSLRLSGMWLHDERDVQCVRDPHPHSKWVDPLGVVTPAD